MIPEVQQMSISGKAASSQSKELKRLKQENAQLREKLELCAAEFEGF